ncbi:MAG: hypothetical protein M0Z42_04830 [Actinomycetota bacterium]|nr:hypothetical protein [Actinomycetota bacterium]
MRVRTERGSVMVLVPVGILVLLLLAAMAVDAATAVLGQRQLANALAVAADDAATAGMNDRVFYTTGAVVLDPAATRVAVCGALAAQGMGTLHDLQLSIGVDGPVVTVSGRAAVDGVFGRAIPGFARWAVAATATATAESARQPSPSPVPTSPAVC